MKRDEPLTQQQIARLILLANSPIVSSPTAIMHHKGEITARQLAAIREYERLHAGYQATQPYKRLRAQKYEPSYGSLEPDPDSEQGRANVERDVRATRLWGRCLQLVQGADGRTFNRWTIDRSLDDTAYPSLTDRMAIDRVSAKLVDHFAGERRGRR